MRESGIPSPVVALTVAEEHASAAHLLFCVFDCDSQAIHRESKQMCSTTCTRGQTPEATQS
jgi:hypothetical protein